jgi:hypothetical protein
MKSLILLVLCFTVTIILAQPAPPACGLRTSSCRFVAPTTPDGYFKCEAVVAEGCTCTQGSSGSCVPTGPECTYTNRGCPVDLPDDVIPYPPNEDIFRQACARSTSFYQSCSANGSIPQTNDPNRPPPPPPQRCVLREQPPTTGLCFSYSRVPGRCVAFSYTGCNAPSGTPTGCFVSPNLRCMAPRSYGDCFEVVPCVPPPLQPGQEPPPLNQ